MSQAEFPTGLSERLEPAGASGEKVPGAERLDRVLREATRRWRGSKLLTLALGGVAVLIAALLVGVLLDAMLGLPAWGLVAIDLVLVALGIGVFVKLVQTAGRSRHDPARTAVAMEQRAGVGSSRLINALQLSRNDTATPRSSETLRQLAIAHGEDAAATLDPATLIDRPARRRAWWSFVGAGVVALAAWLTLPGVFDAVAPRLLSPLAGHPPYTTLRFEVAVGPEVIHVGRPGVVEVTLSREWGDAPLPSEADVVVLQPDGTAQPSPMHRSYREGDVLPPPVGATAEQLAALPAPPTRFSLRFERIDEPIEFYIDTPAGRSDTFTITPDTSPLFESLHATVTPPDYARQAPLTQRLETDDLGATANLVRALRGSAVTFTVKSNVPIAETHLTVSPQSRSRIAANSTPDRTAETFLIVDRSAELMLQLKGTDGQFSKLLPVEIAALEDRAPSVDIHSPEPIAFAVEGYPVPIRVVANDDVGVASVKLHFSLEDHESEPVELANTPENADAQARPRVGVTHTLDLTALGAKPGDTLRYFATARDGLPTALDGPPNDAGQLAETPAFQIQVISEAEWEAMARMQYGIDAMQAEIDAFMAEMQKLAEARAKIVEQLQALQEKLASGEPLNDMERQQMSDLQDQLDAFAEEAQALADAMNERAEVPSVYEFEEPYKERLKELAEQLERQAELAEAMKDAAVPMAGGAEPGESDNANESGDESNEPADSSDPNEPGEPGDPQSAEGSPPPMGDPAEQKSSSGASGLPGVTPTQIEEFLEQAEQLVEEDEPFDEQTDEEMEEFEEDLLRLELAEEMLHHAERIRAVIVGQREVETKLGELKFRDPDDLSADEAQRLMLYGGQEFEMRDELEDAALMLREAAELAGPLLPKMSGTAIQLTEQLDALLVYPDMEQAGEYAEALESALAHASAQVAADKLESLLSDVNNMPGDAESDLDGCLSLPKANLQNAMQQMAGARAGAAMGQMMGQGRGSSGSSGGRANASMIGPRSMGAAPQNAGSGNNAQGDGRSNTIDGLGPELNDAETLNPDSTDTRRRSAIALPGVPARYQDVAAAYFQRLADEAKRGD